MIWNELVIVVGILTAWYNFYIGGNIMFLQIYVVIHFSVAVYEAVY